MQTQIRRRRTWYLIRVCPVCLTNRELRLKWHSLKIRQGHFPSLHSETIDLPVLSVLLFPFSTDHFSEGRQNKFDRVALKFLGPLNSVSRNRYLSKQCRSRWHAFYEPSLQDLHWLPVSKFWLTFLFPAFDNGEFHSRNSGLSCIHSPSFQPQLMSN